MAHIDKCTSFKLKILFEALESQLWILYTILVITDVASCVVLDLFGRLPSVLEYSHLIFLHC